MSKPSEHPLIRGGKCLNLLSVLQSGGINDVVVVIKKGVNAPSSPKGRKVISLDLRRCYEERIIDIE